MKWPVVCTVVLTLGAALVGCGNSDPAEAAHFYGSWKYSDGTGSGDLGVLIIEPGGEGTLAGEAITWMLAKPQINPMGKDIQVIEVVRPGKGPLRFSPSSRGLMEGASGAAALWSSVK